MAQQVEHVLGKDEVTSSNLVSSSIKVATRKHGNSFFIVLTGERNRDARPHSLFQVQSNLAIPCCAPYEFG